MFVRGFYVPILNGKAGELAAIRKLAPEVRQGLVPVLDVPPIPRPWRAGDEPKDPAVELDVLVRRIEHAWGADRRVIVDLEGLESYRPRGLHPVTYLAERAAERGLLVAFCVSSTSSPAARAAVAALRLPSDFVVLRSRIDVGAELQPQVASYRAMIEDLHAPADVTDLIIDLGRLPPGALDLAPLVAEHVRTVRASHPVRSTALASTSLPDFSRRFAFRRVPRSDWALWKRVAALTANAVAFSDYGITGPRRDTDGPARGPAPHLRYTHDDTLYAWKGSKNDRDEDPEPGTTYPELCAKLLRYEDGQRIFRGRRFSAGDEAISLNARQEMASMASPAWVEHATNHHLTQVVRQLSRSN